MLDADGVHVEVNEALCRMTGFARDELIGCGPPFPYWPPEELGTIQAAFERAQRGESTELTLTFCRKDGERLPVLVHPVMVEGSAGQPPLHIATVKDMRAHKRLEQELIASRERWRSIAETPFDYVVEIDRDHRYLYVNHTAPGILAEDLIGKKTPFDFVAPEQHGAMRAAFERAFAEGRPQTYELHVDVVDRWFSSIVGPVFAEGAVASLSILTRDITDAKRAEVALQQSERRLQLALAAGDVGAFDIDLRSGLTYLSPGLYALLGYAEGDAALPKTLDGLLARIHLEDVPAVLAQLGAATAIGSGIDMEGRMRAASDEYRWLHARGRIFEDAGVRHLSGFVTDIQARKRTEEERAQLEVRVRHAQRLETLGTLASGLAHDFNNLLVPVLGNAELLLHQIERGSVLREPVEEIRQAATRARDLIARVLVFGRKSDEQGAPTPVVPAVLEAVQLLRRSSRPNVDLTTKINAPDATILGNAGQLVQVLTNLGINAHQAIGDRPGHISISVDRVMLDEAFAARHGLGGAAVRIAVQDDGAGMTPATLERAFDPFFTTKPVGQGTGLGLAMVHAIVTRNGGAVRVETAPGEGARFELYFPEIACDSAPSPSPSPSTRHAYRILLVDDAAMVLNVLARLLASNGHAVIPVESAAEALARVREAPGSFDLVITDQSMPKMTGLELAAELAGLEPELPVILISGLGDTALVGRGPPNLRAVVAKPPSADELFATVERVVQRRAPSPRP